MYLDNPDLINPGHLRLDNTVMINGKIIDGLSHLRGDEDYFEGVPMSEEWLAKKGFEPPEDASDDRTWKKGKIRLSQSRTWPNRWYLVGTFNVRIEYVHELENVLFMLSKCL